MISKDDFIEDSVGSTILYWLMPFTPLLNMQITNALTDALCEEDL